MSLHTLTWIKTAFEAMLFVILVPLLLWEVLKHPKGVGAKILGQGATLP